MLMLDNWWTSILPIPAFVLALVVVEVHERWTVYRRTKKRREAIRLRAAALDWARRNERKAA